MGYLVQKTSTGRPLLFLMVQSADHITGATGLSPTVTLSKNGAAFGAPAGAVTEIANGWYAVAGNATDNGTNGPLLLHATGAGADPVDDRFEVVSFNPDDGVRLGLTALPNVASGSAGALLVDGTGTAAISNSAGKVLLQATQTGVTIPTVTTLTNAVTLSAGDSPVLFNGTATSGAAGSITDSGKSFTVNALAGNRVKITGGTGAGQTRGIVSNTATAITVDRNWTTTPDATSVYYVLEGDTARLDANLRMDVGAVGGTAQTARDLGASVLLAANQHVIVDSGTVTTVTNQLTAAAIATGVWTDTTAGDFTTALSVGKSVMNGVALGTGLTVAAVSGAVGSVTGAVGSVTGAVGSVTGNVGGVSGVTFPATVASPTNITAGTITTATNVTTVNGLAANVITAASIAADADAEIAGAVWDLATSGHTTSGTFGAAMAAAGAAGDPWSTSLPGSYGAGTAGNIVGNNLNATITSRMATFTLPTNFSALAITGGGAVTAGTVSDKTGYSLATNDSAVLYSGTATSATSTTLTDSGASWGTNQLRGCLAKTTGGTGPRQVRRITSNTGTVLTFDRPWVTTPDATTTYAVLQADAPKVDANSRVDLGAVAGQTVSAAGAVTFNSFVGANTNQNQFFADYAGLTLNCSLGGDVAGKIVGGGATAITGVGATVVGHPSPSLDDVSDTSSFIVASWSTPLPGAYGTGTAGHILGTGIPDHAPGTALGLPQLSNTGQFNYSVNAVNIVNSLADGVISDATFTAPAEAAGRPAGVLGQVRRIFESVPGGNKRTRDRSTGTVKLRNAADSADLLTFVQSTSGTVDTEGKGT